MNVEKIVKDLLQLYYEYFLYDDFEDLDDTSKLDILTELEDELEMHIPTSIYHSNPSEREFVELVCSLYEGGL
jgi:hypothetical protein